MSGKPYVYITRGIPPQGWGYRTLREKFNIDMYDESQGIFIPRQELLKKVKGADAILVHPPDKLDSEALDAAGPQLKVIGTFSVGLEHIDLKECAKRNIKVGYTPNILTDAVAEGAMALILSTARRYKEAFVATTDGGWGSSSENGLYLCGKDIKGSTVGIVGLGRIGLAVAKRLRAFEVSELLYSGNTPKENAKDVDAHFVPFNDLLAKSDYVIACCSVNKGNVGLFDAEAFRRMKKSAIFINTARGVLVNQEDLYTALTTGEIHAAGLDVTTPEPLPLDSPLLTLKNCTIVPHLGSASVRVRNDMADLVVRNILAGLNGEPLITPVPTD